SKSKDLQGNKIISTQTMLWRYIQDIRIFVLNSNDYRSLEWICSCKSGKRTVGCCTHVASVIYYLACGHKNEKIPMPGLKLNSLLIPICLNSEDYDVDQLLNEENSDNSDIDNENNEKSIITSESDENEQGEFDCLTKRSINRTKIRIKLGVKHCFDGISSIKNKPKC
ncbi:hypothetical protein BpHYR1_034182, partial [Brachionus plicatilis]